MTEQEKEEFKSLCDYVFTEILNYNKDENRFPRHLALRLKGMQYGDYIYKKTSEEKTKIYTFKLIHSVFVYKKSTIKMYMDRTEFTNERHMINSIMVIIDNSINDVLNIIKSQINSKKKTEKENIIIKDSTSKANYKRKTARSDKRNEEIW